MAFTVIPSEIRDPLSFYKRLRMTRSNTCMLESCGEYNPAFSRYSMIGALPAEILTRSGDVAQLTDVQNCTSTKIVSWLETLDRWSNVFRPGDRLGPTQPGAIGYIGYDNKYEFERLQKRTVPDVQIPDIYLVRYDIMLVQDRMTGECHWVANEGCERQCAELESLLSSKSAIDPPQFSLRSPLTPDFTHDQYYGAIRRTSDYIHSGDIFQANITGRFSAGYEGDVIHLYERLRHVTPNPFFALLDFPNPIISTSPERFLAVRNGRVHASPIKGTVESSIDGADQRATLERSDKDRAENIMIVDLMRNDIGKFCEKDSVRVDSLCAVKKFNNLYHLESTISGTIKPQTRLSDIFRAVFPCGSVTGAPKIRAMDIIEELEVTRRGPYTGAIGFVGTNGWIDLSVAIRIAYFHEGKVYVHAGGGIVADSEPEAEYRELLAKIRGIKQTLESF